MHGLSLRQKAKSLKTGDILSLSWSNLKSNKLSTGITIAIMALGIFALILIITTITALTKSLNDNFSVLGANSFSIRYRDRFSMNNKNSEGSAGKESRLRQRKSNYDRVISYEEARTFKDKFQYPGVQVSIAVRGASGLVVNTSREKTNPEISLFGSDESYLALNGYKLFAGRNFTPAEAGSNANVCILGFAVFERLFKGNADKALSGAVNIDNRPFRVIGIMEEKTSSSFFNSGKIAVAPVNTVRSYYSTNNSSFVIGVISPDAVTMNMAEGEAMALFRPIRNLAVTDQNNFAIEKSDSLAQSFLKNLSYIQSATLFIAFITLLCAAIGLMNIMLVKVKERTKEIGLAKALGSNNTSIRKQFLFESVLISVLGAVFGIITGIALGNVIGIFLKSGFVVPWAWIAIATVICGGVGLLAGLYPAYKASKLDPIVALRYE